jgi:hypothetical protein
MNNVASMEVKPQGLSTASLDWNYWPVLCDRVSFGRGYEEINAHFPCRELNPGVTERDRRMIGPPANFRDP